LVVAYQVTQMFIVRNVTGKMDMKGSLNSATVQHFVERLGKSLGHDHKSTLVNPRGTSRLLLKVLT